MILLASCNQTGSLEKINPLGNQPSKELTDRGATFCEIAEPFHWSLNDTQKSIIQAKKWNAKGEALCGW